MNGVYYGLKESIFVEVGSLVITGSKFLSFNFFFNLDQLVLANELMLLYNFNNRVGSIPMHFRQYIRKSRFLSNKIL
jgi:hypothetical protein